MRSEALITHELRLILSLSDGDEESPLLLIPIHLSPVYIGPSSE
jgi:hypothetical protein